MSKATRNIAASVRQKLKNLAIREKRPFAELLQYYAMERFLFRLSKSKHADCFILKGALMLRLWQLPELTAQFRTTMDIDMLGQTSNEVDNICSQVADIIAVTADDGFIFDAGSIKGQRIKEEPITKVFECVLSAVWMGPESTCNSTWVLVISSTPAPLEPNSRSVWISRLQNISVIAGKVSSPKNLKP